MAKRKDAKGQDYHHGDLKRSLLNEAVKIVAKEGVEALSLRELARRLGVSHTAPYRHFPDKKALLKAIAEEGFQALLDQMSRDGGGDFQEIGWQYVKFALANPEHINVMFGAELSPRNDDGCKLPLAETTFDFVTKAIDSAKAEGKLKDGDTLMQAVASWAMVHGLSVLLINGRLADKALADMAPEKLAKAVTSILMQGLAKK